MAPDSSVTALPSQQLLEEIPSLLRPSATPPKPLHGVVHHINTGSAAPGFARPRRLDPEKHHRRGGILHHGESRYYSPLKLALGIPPTSGSQEGWVVASLRRLPPPERRHNT